MLEIRMSCKEISPVCRGFHTRASEIISSGKKFVWVNRKCLPCKMVKNDFSVWTFVKQCIGKELSKITMPIILNEPLSFLQRIAEYMEYSELLDKAIKEKDPVKRMEYVSAFAVSSMSSNANRIGKPFNPLLGETYELHYNNFVFVAEQVSHHPPITAFHVESENYHLRATVQFKIRFWGIYSQLEFHPSNWLGQGCNRFTGELYIPSNLDNFISCSYTSSIIAANKSDSYVLKKIIFGNWSRGFFTVDPNIWNEREEISELQKVNNSSDNTESLNNSEGNDTPNDYGFEIPLNGQHCLWCAKPKPSNSLEYYSFTEYAIGLNELNTIQNSLNYNDQSCTVNTTTTTTTTTTTINDNILNCIDKMNEIPCEKNSVYGKFLPPTDSRYRPDLRLFEMGHIDEAASEKLRLEEKQRHTRKLLSQRKNSSGFSWSLSSGHKTGRDSCSVTPNSTSGSGQTIKGGITNNPFRRTVSSNSTVTNQDDSHCVTTTFSSDTTDVNNSSPIVGPVWFIASVNPFTKQEEWIFTGEYWSRDWRKCPDLY
ncbi:unnamed protein product [Heterobilharzia americana]|nr:unnamed protein product [Heterobilharzia americana]